MNEAIDVSLLRIRIPTSELFCSNTAGSIVDDYTLIKNIDPESRVQIWKALGTDGKHYVIKFCTPSTRNRAFVRKTDEFRLRQEIGHVDGLVAYHKLLQGQLIETGEHFHAIVMDYVEGKELYEYATLGLSEDKILYIARQLIEIVHTLHKKGFVHRDIKLENIIIDDLMRVTLVDFDGLARVTQENIPFAGTRGYASPEIRTTFALRSVSDYRVMHNGEEVIVNWGANSVSSSGYAYIPVDMWCIGTVLFILLYGIMPIVYPESAHHAFVKRPVGPRLAHIVDELLRIDPQRRPTASKCLMMLEESAIPSKSEISCPLTYKISFRLVELLLAHKIMGCTFTCMHCGLKIICGNGYAMKTTPSSSSFELPTQEALCVRKSDVQDTIYNHSSTFKVEMLEKRKTSSSLDTWSAPSPVEERSLTWGIKVYLKPPDRRFGSPDHPMTTTLRTGQYTLHIGADGSILDVVDVSIASTVSSEGIASCEIRSPCPPPPSHRE